MTDKRVPIAEDYAAIARGLREIEAKKAGHHVSAALPDGLTVNCAFCWDVGWVSNIFLGRGPLVCHACLNPLGKPAPP